jgi:NitT/TauT family transport system permease protein
MTVDSTIGAGTVRERDSRSRRAMAARLRRGPVMLVVPVVFVALWWIVGALMGGLRGQIITAPPKVVAALGRLLTTGEVYTNLGVSVEEYAIALVIALVSAIVLGLLVGASRRATDLLEPLVLAVYSVPKVALYPILLIFLGLTTKTITALGVMQGFYPAFFATLGGLRAMNPLHLELARSMEASRLQTYRKVVLWSALGPIIAGSRVSAILCFHGVITGEIISGKSGMGFQVIHYYQAFDYPNMYASIIVTGAIVVAVYLGAKWLERRLLSLVGGS